ncbi:hypothetical protein PSH03_005416 [Micromonospora sp. PSH03]|uniref:hypothetical protein n=1 Tax=Micromonospora salmantinae TaxID=2911211 RepID=UPI001EE8E657|nr:hypothetical protein [Micromonospora salmantinae]MCG5459632.1 hypothetical protein [Micromonospora salmantinae]
MTSAEPIRIEEGMWVRFEGRLGRVLTVRRYHTEALKLVEVNWRYGGTGVFTRNYRGDQDDIKELEVIGWALPPREPRPHPSVTDPTLQTSIMLGEARDV